MSEIKVDTIGPRVDNGTLTIGASGDTVNIAGTAGTGFPTPTSGIAASAITTGTIATARLGSGTASSSTFLAGDQSYKTVSGTTINNNANNRVITGSASANTLEGESTLTYDATTLSNIPSGTQSNIRLQNSTTGSGASDGLLLQQTGNDTYIVNYENAGMYFRTNNTDHLTILSDGKVGIGKTSSLRGFDVQIPSVNNYMAEFKNNTNDRPHGLYMEFSQATPNRDDEKFLYCGDQSAARLTINANGNVKNANNSYGAISDRRLKENITDANSQWNDIKKIKFKNFNLINETTTQLGVIAQDLETEGMNGLVSNSPADKHQIAINAEFGTLEDDTDNPNEDGTFPKKIKENLEKVKGVKYSVLLLKSAKALQEAMEKIETLEAKVTALENA